LSRALSDVPKIKEAYLYGSFARKDSDQHSDIDLLIIGEPQQDVLETVVRRLERSFGREINYTVLSEAELKRKLARSDPFIGDVWRGKKVKLVAA
jgi:predicted nucleotidyltransferase